MFSRLSTLDSMSAEIIYESNVFKRPLKNYKNYLVYSTRTAIIMEEEKENTC